VPKGPAHSCGSIRILIAGTVELRKGIPYVLQAARLLNDPRFLFRFVGPNRLQMKAVNEQFIDSICGCRIEFAGPVPRSEMSQEYQNADVLLHASLAEGSANVCYEAMAHGLPVITTPNSGSAIRDGIEGRLIPIRTPEQIAAALSHTASSPMLLGGMGQAARHLSTQLTLTQYQKNLTQVIRTAFK
jgi:glycosyltransferase involved in cell wall biosynthesis